MYDAFKGKYTPPYCSGLSPVLKYSPYVYQFEKPLLVGLPAVVLFVLVKATKDIKSWASFVRV
jgi:hypothetical protein